MAPTDVFMPAVQGMDSDALRVDFAHPIGQGAMGSVHVGTWLGTKVAVKVIRTRQGTAIGSVTRRSRQHCLREEAEALSRLRHPCICSFFGTVLVEGGEAIVLEYLPGGSLSTLLHGDVVFPPSEWACAEARAATGVPHAAPRTAPTLSQDACVPGSSLTTALACRIARETASGIAFLHANQYMHRDIKSANILLDAKCNAKVADFGLAKMELSELSAELPPRSPSDDMHTSGCGTLKYMAPEVPLTTRSPQPAYGQSCDVYSFGILLWEILHGRRPFEQLSGRQAIMAVLRGERPPLLLGEDRIDFAPIITSCWHQEAAQRPLMKVVVQDLLQIEDALARLTKEELAASAMGTVLYASLLQVGMAPPSVAPVDVDLGMAINGHQWHPMAAHSVSSINVDAMATLSSRAAEAMGLEDEAFEWPSDGPLMAIRPRPESDLLKDDPSTGTPPSLMPAGASASSPPATAANALVILHDQRWQSFTRFLGSSRTMLLWQKAIRLVRVAGRFVSFARELVEVRRDGERH